MTKSQRVNAKQGNVSSDDEPTPSKDISLNKSNSTENVQTISQTNYHLPAVIIECFVSLASDQIISVELESKCTGQDVIDKVCQKLGIIEESAYFGLQYRGRYHEVLWVNLRNRISRQIPHSGYSQVPYRLDFRVKYFVQPHTIISEETRHQFYLHAKNRITEGCWSHGAPMSDLYHVIALMSQAHFGDYHHSTSCMKYALFWPKTMNEDISSVGIKETSHFHQSLVNWSDTKCEYELLRIIADNWLMYGVFFHDVVDCFSKALKLGIGPEGFFLCSTKFGLIEQYTFESITKINYTDKVIEIEKLQDNGQTTNKKYCLKSANAAKSMQRFVTETNSFFKCDTVDNEIIENHKSVSHFFKKTNSSISYLYDVTKTSREVYDMARRRAHSCSSNASLINQDVTNGNNDVAMKADSTATSDEVLQQQEKDELRKEVEMLRELVQCVVCKDRKINRLFIPCMHIVCCEMCASRLNQCPICRKEIQISHHAYPRWMNDNMPVASKSALCTLPEDQALVEESYN